MDEAGEEDLSAIDSESAVLEGSFEDDDFAFAVFQVLAQSEKTPGNFVISPISLALGMERIASGVDDERAMTIVRRLGFGDDADAMQQASAILRDELESRLPGGGVSGIMEYDVFKPHHESDEPDEARLREGLSITFVDRLWTAAPSSNATTGTEQGLVSSYGDDHRERKAEPGLDEERQKVNEEISLITNSFFGEYLEEGVELRAGKNFAIHAAAFHGQWEQRFRPDRSSDEPFFLLDGGSVDVRTLHYTPVERFAEVDGDEILERRFPGMEVIMYFILPASGELERFLLNFNRERFRMLIQSLRFDHKGPVRLPVFSVDSSFEMNEIFAEIGVEDVFGKDAGSDPAVGAFYHRARISIDEEGINDPNPLLVASAQEMVQLAGISRRYMYFEANRPFFFVIYDKPTDSVLFIGRVMNPGSVE